MNAHHFHVLCTCTGSSHERSLCVCVRACITRCCYSQSSVASPTTTTITSTTTATHTHTRAHTYLLYSIKSKLRACCRHFGTTTTRNMSQCLVTVLVVKFRIHLGSWWSVYHICCCYCWSVIDASRVLLRTVEQYSASNIWYLAWVAIHFMLIEVSKVAFYICVTRTWIWYNWCVIM